MSSHFHQISPLIIFFPGNEVEGIRLVPSQVTLDSSGRQIGEDLEPAHSGGNASPLTPSLSHAVDIILNFYLLPLCIFLDYLISLFSSIFFDAFPGVAAKIDEHTKRVKLLVDLGRKEDRERDAERVREKRRERKMKYEKKGEDGAAGPGEGGGRVAILGGAEDPLNEENGEEENGDEENRNDENELDEYGNNKYDKGRYEGNDFGSDNDNDEVEDEDENSDSEDDIKKYKTIKVQLKNKKGTKRNRVEESDNDDDDEEEYGEVDLKAQEAMALKMLRKK